MFKLLPPYRIDRIVAESELVEENEGMLHWLTRMRAISLVSVALGGIGCHGHVAFVQHRTFLRHSIVSLSAENDNDVSKVSLFS